MQTQCPHCDTKFRVTENQLQAANGFVRCGICSEVFNTQEIQSTETNEENIPEPSLLEANEQSIPPTEPSIEADINSDAVNTSDSTKNTGDKEKDTPEIDKEVFDLFDEEENESLQHIVPEKFRDSYSSQSPRWVPTARWSAGILVLISTLTMEYLWFNRDEFVAIPEFQDSFSQICQQIDCSSSSLRAPEKIELITRNVYTHPKQKGALMIDVTMKNNASFAQPYPVMQIEFSNIRGAIVAARRFHPHEYAKTEVSTESKVVFLKPNVNTNVTLEIKDPGKQAMAYEFNFL